MDSVVQPSASVGSLVKKIIMINPDLGVEEIIRMVKQSIEIRVSGDAEFGGTEIIDEEKALRLARETTKNV